MISNHYSEFLCTSSKSLKVRKFLKFFKNSSRMTDIEVVKEELYGIDKWVTGLVDLIPTQVYVSFFKNSKF